MRIQFTERYAKEISEQDLDYCDKNGLDYPEPEYDYRLVSIQLTDIFAIKQMPGKKRHCHIETYDDRLLTVKGSYEDVLQFVTDREAQMAGDLEIENGIEE